MEIQVIASGSTGNAYRISDGKTALLLDAGIPFAAIQRGLRFRIRQLSACLVTHAHSDHVRGAKELARNGIDIYISSGAADAAGLLGHRIHRVTALQKFTVESFEILPFDVQHDTPEPLGFFIHSTFTGERLLYFTDTYYLKYTFPGLTHIMGECNHSREGIHDSIEAGRITTDLASRLVKSHMSIDRLEEMLKANDLSKLKQIYLLHLSDNNSRPEEFRQRIADLTGVEVLLT